MGNDLDLVPLPADTPPDLVRGKLLETMDRSGADLKHWQHDLLTTNPAGPLPRVTDFSRSKGSLFDPLDSIMEQSLMRADDNKPTLWDAAKAFGKLLYNTATRPIASVTEVKRNVVS